MKSQSLDRRSTLRWGAVLGTVLACVLASQACTTSEDGDVDPSGGAGTTGSAGTGAQNVAGTTGSAGSSSTGAAGTGSSNAGTAGTKAVTGAAGTTGTAGTTGKAGSGGGAGSVGSTGSAGTTGAAGTGSSSGAAGTGVVYTFTTGIENILTLSCGGCHLEGTSVPIKGNFGTSWAKVMGSVTSDHMNCPNLDASKKRVVPGKPENSMLYIKVAVPNLPGSCGSHMPANGVNMGASQIQAIKDWILAGAPM
jgi:hypothetical protein